MTVLCEVDDRCGPHCELCQLDHRKDNAMNALHVTFTTDLPDDALRPAQRAFAERLTFVPGFVSKTWLRNGAVHGGFYLFETIADAHAYIDGLLFAGLREFADLTVQEYAVDAEVGALPGRP